MTVSAMKRMFLAAAIFNGSLIIAGLAPQFFLGLFRISPLPTEPLFVHLFFWLVFVFGIAYYWIARDPAGNLPLIRLGIIGKLGVVAVCLADVSLGIVSWQLMILASVDLAFAMLFWKALKVLRSGLSG